MAMMCRGFRGATTASDNTSLAIVEATEELLRAMVEANDLDPEYIAAAWFTTTPDLTAEFPATVARRRLGWTGVALMNSHEIDVPDGQVHVHPRHAAGEHGKASGRDPEHLPARRRKPSATHRGRRLTLPRAPNAPVPCILSDPLYRTCYR